MTVKDTLIEARKVIEDPKAWGQGFREERPGTHCAQEALSEAGGSIQLAEEALRQAADLDNRFLTSWNDEPGRTHAEVLDLYDRAIAAA